MKPFDLERAKSGAQLVTRSGRKVTRFEHSTIGDDDFPCEAHFENGEFGYFTEEGSYHGYGVSDLDLFMAPDTRTVYVNVFPGGHADWFDTEAEARAGLNARALKIAAPVTFEV